MMTEPCRIGDEVDAKIMGKWRSATVIGREEHDGRVTYTLKYLDARGETGYANKSARLIRAAAVCAVLGCDDHATEERIPPGFPAAEWLCAAHAAEYDAAENAAEYVKTRMMY